MIGGHSGRISRRQGRRSRGQSLVEFALVLPVFLLILFGLLDVGRFVYLNSTLSQAAREGARLGAVEAGWLPPAAQDTTCNKPNGAVCPADVSTLRTHITDAADRMMAPFGSVSNVYTSCDVVPNPSTGLPALPSGNWTTTTCGTHTSRDLISVRVTSTFDAITPIVANILGSVPLTGSATMAIN